MPETVIVGAGPAGLTAAYELSKLGLPGRIIEAGSQVGGLSRTTTYNGYRFDIGGHRFFSKVPLVNRYWREILGSDFLVRSRLSRIFYKGHFFDYPIRLSNTFAGLGPLESLLIGFSYAKAQISFGREETTFEQWVSNRFGKRLYRVFFETYTRKVWGIPGSEISADWASQRIKDLSLWEVIAHALFRRRKPKEGKSLATLIDSFHYPRLGPGMMWEACEEILRGRGYETKRGLRVRRVRHHHGRVVSLVASTDSGSSVEIGGTHFVSTMPLQSLVHSLDPVPPNKVLRAARRLTYRDFLTVVLIVKRENVFSDNWIYVHSPNVSVARIQNYKNWSPDMVPNQMRTSLGLEYFLSNRSEKWKWSDQRLIDMGVRECVRLRLIEAREVEDATVVRVEKAYPVYDREYRENLAIIRRYLETIKNIQSIGRNGQHRYNNQDHSMLTGVFAARRVAGQDVDAWSVNCERDYHEEGSHGEMASASDRMIPMPIPAQLDGHANGTTTAETSI